MEPEQTTEQIKEKGSWWKFLREIAEFVFLTLVIVVPIRVYVAQPYIVNGTSMYPTFENGDYLIVDQLSYRFEEPNYGDVIVFRYPQDQSKFFIKRVIGKPNDTLRIHDNEVTITNAEHPGGTTFEEPYVVFKFPETKTFTVSKDQYFVMGDNRAASFDSRSWGPLPEKLIMGRALVRLLPFKELGIFPGKADFFATVVPTSY